MIDIEIIENAIEVIELHSVYITENEVNGYEYGSYYIPEYNASGVSYLELYSFFLSHILELLNEGLDYTNFGFIDDDIKYVINNSNELIFNYE